MRHRPFISLWQVESETQHENRACSYCIWPLQRDFKMWSQQGLRFRSWCLSAAAVAVLGIHRVDKRDKSNRSTKRIVIGCCSSGFRSIWGKTKLRCRGQEKKEGREALRPLFHALGRCNLRAEEGRFPVSASTSTTSQQGMGAKPWPAQSTQECTLPFHPTQALQERSPSQQEDQEMLTGCSDTRKFSIRVGTWCFSDTTDILVLAGFQLL